jgi:hypothetical protein
MISFILGFLLGMLILLGYMVKRMLGSSAWDDSNMTNALRLISHTVVHPADFAEMYYLTEGQLALLNDCLQYPDKPFWYINKDELSEVVKTRPTKE